MCEQDDGEPAYVCTGPCVSAYHLRCLELSTAGSSPPSRENWLCPYCSSHTQRCFHCKKLGSSSSLEKSGSNSGVESPPAVATAAAASSSGSGLPVRKCRALSCGKFYHHECITALPLARIAGTHFICPVRIESLC